MLVLVLVLDTGGRGIGIVMLAVIAVWAGLSMILLFLLLFARGGAYVGHVVGVIPAIYTVSCGVIVLLCCEGAAAKPISRFS